MREWNRFVRYRCIHGRHLVIDISKKNRLLEVSPALASLVRKLDVLPFEEAFELWVEGQQNKLGNMQEEVQAMLEDAEIVVRNE